MVSEKFRRQLRTEAEKWLAEELIDPQIYARLTQRYQFSNLETVARNRFVMILLGLGSILLGLGIITFVAANWQVWSRGVKVTLLLSLFVAVNVMGFYLGRRSTEDWQYRIGSGLLLLGGLILGANMALMSQMFHQSGPIYQLFLVWGLGVLAMAYSLRLTLLAILAIILTSTGYLSAITTLDSVYRSVEVSGFGLALQHFPLLVSFLFIPLAYWCRSKWLFGLSALAIIISLEFNLIFVGRYVPWHVSAVLAACVPAAWLWAYRDSLLRVQPANTSIFSPIARSLAVVFLSFLFYFFSFHYFWQDTNFPQPTTQFANHQILVLVDALVFLGLAIFAWWRLGQSPENSSSWRIDSTSATIGLMILTTGVLFAWHFTIEPLNGMATLIFNILLLVLAIGLVRQGLLVGKRSGFWLGILLLVLQIFSRMFEYNTGLLLKAIVLFACGLGVILAGLWFERYLQEFRT